MPRKARIDAPGAFHHVIIRGIERRKIFRSDYDRKNFIKRLQKLIPDTQTDCFAWALIPNHVHLILKTGLIPISVLMSRLLTGHDILPIPASSEPGNLFLKIINNSSIYSNQRMKRYPNGLLDLGMSIR